MIFVAEIERGLSVGFLAEQVRLADAAAQIERRLLAARRRLSKQVGLGRSRLTTARLVEPLLDLSANQ